MRWLLPCGQEARQKRLRPSASGHVGCCGASAPSARTPSRC